MARALAGVLAGPARRPHVQRTLTRPRRPRRRRAPRPCPLHAQDRSPTPSATASPMRFAWWMMNRSSGISTLRSDREARAPPGLGRGPEQARARTPAPSCGLRLTGANCQGCCAEDRTVQANYACQQPVPGPGRERCACKASAACVLVCLCIVRSPPGTVTRLLLAGAVRGKRAAARPQHPHHRLRGKVPEPDPLVRLVQRVSSAGPRAVQANYACQQPVPGPARTSQPASVVRVKASAACLLVCLRIVRSQPGAVTRCLPAGAV